MIGPVCELAAGPHKHKNKIEHAASHRKLNTYTHCNRRCRSERPSVVDFLLQRFRSANKRSPCTAQTNLVVSPLFRRATLCACSMRYVMFLSIQSFSVLIRSKTATNCPACWRLSEKSAPISSASFSRLIPKMHLQNQSLIIFRNINSRTFNTQETSRRIRTPTAGTLAFLTLRLHVCIGRSQKKSF